MSEPDDLLRALVARVAKAVEIGRSISERLERIESAMRGRAAPSDAIDAEARLWTVADVARFTALKPSTVYEKATTAPFLACTSARHSASIRTS